MNFIHRQGGPLRKRPSVFLAFLLALALGFADIPTFADPASTLQTLMIVDQGDFLSFQWSFYYVDFPSRFVLKEKQSKVISLDNPPTLYENISDIVSVAFDLRIDGQPIQPDKISRLTLSPNKVCTVTLIYRGRPGGRMELRAPVLQYLPPVTMINYEILRLGQTRNVITGNLMGHESPFPQVIVYREAIETFQSMPIEESVWFALFKSELRTAWINSNWVLISLILLVVYKPAKVCVPLLILIAGWGAICVLYAANIKFPWTISELILGLPTALLGLVAARHPQKGLWLGLIACGAGFLNACYDLQQIRWTAEDGTSFALMGLCLGFACGLLSLVLALGIVLGECKKYRDFQVQYAPGICLLMAATAILLPAEKFFFR
jgi:hypothetical protein